MSHLAAGALIDDLEPGATIADSITSGYPPIPWISDLRASLQWESEHMFSLVKAAEGPLVAVAVHNGHDLRTEIGKKMALPEPDRLREEDPYTGRWTEIGDTRIIVRQSRFEHDLNRPRDTAIYRRPEDAWGLQMWSEELTDDEVARSLASYDSFYQACHRCFSELEKQFGFFVVYDLHSYNHMRNGPDGEAADPASNPEVNVGTGSLDRGRWGTVVDTFIEGMRSFDFLGRSLDVRENVKFLGRQLAKWTHENFPDSGCVLAVEFKKFWMDEWSGELHQEKFDAITRALGSTTAEVVAAARQASKPGPRAGQRST